MQVYAHGVIRTSVAFLVVILVCGFVYVHAQDPSSKPQREAATPRTSATQTIPVHKYLAKPPQPTTKVYVDLARRREVPFVDWLKYWGNSADVEATGPVKRPPFDGVEGQGDADPKTGKMDVRALPSAPLHIDEKKKSIYWDFKYTGTEPMDVDLAATFSGKIQPLCYAACCGDLKGGGGTAEVDLYLVAKDKTSGKTAKMCFWEEYYSADCPFPVTRKRTGEARLPLRLEPNHEYRFSLVVYACAYTFEAPKSSPETQGGRGTAEARVILTLGALALPPTNGPAVEVQICEVHPSAYDTWDGYETLLSKLRMAYMPTGGEISVSIGGQYALPDSTIRISILGGGKLSLPKPDVLARTGFTAKHVSDNTISFTPPPAAAITPPGTVGFRLPILVDAELDPTVWKLCPGDRLIEPLRTMWSRLDFRLPDKPKLIVPQNRWVRLMDAANWYIVMPAQPAFAVISKSPCVPSKQVLAFYAAPSDNRAPAPAANNWQIKTVAWEKLAGPSLAKTDQPLLAVNAAALADLYAVLVIPPRQLPPTEPPARAATPRNPTVEQADAPRSLTSKDDLKAAYLAPATNGGYFTGSLWARQLLANDLSTVIREFVKSANIALDGRPELLLYVADDGEVITAKSLLEGMEWSAALTAMRSTFDERMETRPVLALYRAKDGEIITVEGMLEDLREGTVKPPKSAADRISARFKPSGEDGMDPSGKLRSLLLVPHLNLYGQLQTLQIRGIAANGPFKAICQDEKKIIARFDFLPRHPKAVEPLIPPPGNPPDGTR